MDLGRQLKLAIATGTLLFGVKQTQDACARGEARMVIFAPNCPEDVTSDLRARHPELLFHRTDLVNRELGTALEALRRQHDLHHGCGERRPDGSSPQLR